MARARTGPAGGYAWALAVFGAGFFICLILAIVFYTQIGGLKQTADTAQSELATVATSAQLQSTDITNLEGEGTIVYRLQQQKEALQNQTADLANKLQKAETQAAQELERFEQQKAAADEAQAALNAAQQSLTQMRTELTQQVSAMSEQIATAETVNEQFQQKIQQASAEMAEGSSAQIAAMQEQSNEQQVALLEVRAAKEELERTIAIITKPQQLADAPDVSPADATITGFGADRDRVYLDLGRDANLRLGMAFNVFDADELIKVDNSQITGKAIVEIIRIEPTTSVARVVEIQDRARLETGDKVANIAFDPNRVFTFFVYGQFDLNNDGDIDLDDTSRVRNLILDSGGELAENLTFEVEYLVLGVEPEFPDKPQDTTDLLAMKEYRVQLENYQAYQDLIAQAQALNIPVLNQNRFLDLIGYYVR